MLSSAGPVKGWRMPRRARIDAPGALHHLIVRGIERGQIFRDNRDRNQFMDRLGDVLTGTGTPCFAWALIPNHIHLLVRTGQTPIATVMRRLLTGYAVYFNRRHHRHGQLFQNRYKSILCQEDPYLLELVRYIHLNPLRATLVPDLKGLTRFAYGGHSVIMGKRQNNWQDVDYILGFFDAKLPTARRRYNAFVKQGISQGKRPDLVGGGLLRSLGGWSAVKAQRKSAERLKGDERILGDSHFVETVLEAADEAFHRGYLLQKKGYDLDRVAERVARVLQAPRELVWYAGKQPDVVKARSLLCYWAARELGMSMTALAQRLGISQPAVSISVRRGEAIAAENGYQLLKG